MSHRNYNVGQSNYSKYKYQCWDIWEDFNLNSLEGDIVKRLLRVKDGEARETDLEKIKHVLIELISVAKAKHKKNLQNMKKITDEYQLSEKEKEFLYDLLINDNFCKLNKYIHLCNEVVKMISAYKK